MSLLDSLFGQIANTVQNHSSPNTPGPAYDSNPLLGAISGILGNFANERGEQFNGYDPNADYSQHGGFDPGQLFGNGQNVQPASQDPYGDPANQAQGLPANVRPASEDPYGDPADQGQGGLPANVRPASEDPYGDPADQR